MSTTPVDPRVVDEMQTCLDFQGDFANPASMHAMGQQARARIITAKQQVAALIHATPEEIIWTSGATESINLAIKGVAQFYQRQGKHIITAQTEHKATLETCHFLASQGFEVTYLAPEKTGLIDHQKVKNAIRKDTILCSFMHVNNETGVIQDIETIGNILREHGVWFHVDAVQGVGKLPINVKTQPIDLLSFSAHKIYGPKGIGALYVRRNPRVQLVPQIHGGDADNFQRAGTLPTHQIVGMGKACEIMLQEGQAEMVRFTELRDQLWKNLSRLPGITLNGDKHHRIGNCLNIQINQINPAHFLKALSMLAFATGSACNAADPAPSHVLMAMGLSKEQAQRSFRLSVGRLTTLEDVNTASEDIRLYMLKTKKTDLREK